MITTFVTEYIDSLAKTIKLKKSNMEMQQKIQKSQGSSAPKPVVESASSGGFELVHLAGAFIIAFLVGLWYGS